MQQLVLIDPDEQRRRIDRLHTGGAGLLIAGNANLFYLTGRVFAGYLWLGPNDRTPAYFVKRPTGISGERVTYIRKPEDMASFIGQPQQLALELDTLSYSDVKRLKAIFPEAELINASPALRAARAVKTRQEQDLLAADARRHENVYRRIPSLFREGMTDIELQIEIERLSRLEGCIGQFRISGTSMELYMGNVITGRTADTPSPYDFAMGGAGIHPSLPVGASGEIIRPGTTVMVDMNGNFNGYMTDMTRVFTPSADRLPAIAAEAHNCSIAITRRLAKIGLPGAKAADLYREAETIVREAGLTDYFMGHSQHAGFVGHGVGIEINELPVIAPRSRDILAAGNVIALEPKFVIPDVGAVGIENTYIVGNDGMRRITCAPEEIIELQ